jgi:hypothetical protein
MNLWRTCNVLPFIYDPHHGYHAAKRGRCSGIPPSDSSPSESDVSDSRDTRVSHKVSRRGSKDPPGVGFFPGDGRNSRQPRADGEVDSMERRKGSSPDTDSQRHLCADGGYGGPSRIVATTSQGHQLSRCFVSADRLANGCPGRNDFGRPRANGSPRRWLVANAFPSADSPFG